MFGHVISYQPSAWSGLAAPQHEINKSNQKSGEGEERIYRQTGLLGVRIEYTH